MLPVGVRCGRCRRYRYSCGCVVDLRLIYLAPLRLLVIPVVVCGCGTFDLLVVPLLTLVTPLPVTAICYALPGCWCRQLYLPPRCYLAIWNVGYAVTLRSRWLCHCGIEFWIPSVDCYPANVSCWLIGYVDCSPIGGVTPFRWILLLPLSHLVARSYYGCRLLCAPLRYPRLFPLPCVVLGCWRLRWSLLNVTPVTLIAPLMFVDYA